MEYGVSEDCRSCNSASAVSLSIVIHKFEFKSLMMRNE
jgi:hypothetical protein